MSHASGDVLEFRPHAPVVCGRSAVVGGIEGKTELLGESMKLRDRLLSELN